MEIDMTTLTDEAAAKLWDDLNAGEAAPFEEQNDMIKFSVRSKVLPIMLAVIPTVETAIKERMIATINEAHDAGHAAEFTLMALVAELSDGE